MMPAQNGDTGAGMQAEQLKQLIEAGIPSAQADVQGDGDHFEATVVSAAFEGKSKVQQHQMVYGSLGELMQGAVHALALRTFTPEQWAQQIR
jgi:acid stress-induced BolA-like protein IbaG/YrbA